MRYRRDCTTEAIDATVAHVRDHLASVADPDDDPSAHADDVLVSVVAHVDGQPGLVSVIGELDTEPSAPYLRPGWTSEQDIRDNPLSVEPIED